MKRISPTLIEKFRRCSVGMTPYDTEQAFIDTLTGVFTGNDKTKVGSAYHAIIEGRSSISFKGVHVLLEEEGVNILFHPNQVEPAYKYAKEHRGGLFETPIYGTYESKYGLIQVHGRVDCQEGVNVRDTKVTFRSPDMQSYSDSYQWRYYLDILNRPTSMFFYDFFQVHKFKELPLTFEEIFEQLPSLPLSPYDRMHDDCVSMLNDCLDYIYKKGLQGHLKDAVEEFNLFE